ncbi:hypothetical protein [Methanolobus profundi]|uniref:Uncharacterized protein n=1 Tax=Methanolobus profundi TaxID=487685 RepID=A0A1I4UPR1_9EURY|nr:hypothetical protein [Methanolobus profundi]SFM90964.1 hypothetical protein SAMN04488696_2831 [Methanolobus profundi]
MLIAVILFTHFVIMGSVSNLYSIQNYDGNEHTVSVEILNSNHRTIMADTYTVGPHEGSSPRERPFLYKLPFTEEKFTFNITVDNNTTESQTLKVPHYYDAFVTIYIFYPEDENTIPILVECVVQE